MLRGGCCLQGMVQIAAGEPSSVLRMQEGSELQAACAHRSSETHSTVRTLCMLQDLSAGEACCDDCYAGQRHL